jgi:inosine-uridine nucleoside N-ribohydrolase
MSIALNPTIATDWGEHYVEIEIQSELGRGMSIVDRLNVVHDERNYQIWAQALNGRKAKVCWAIDNQRWKAALYEALC